MFEYRLHQHRVADLRREVAAARRGRKAATRREGSDNGAGTADTGTSRTGGTSYTTAA
ncbi:hypothetical protein GCM10027160_37250 [Streptomyces calidiresistens]|uniref:Uncharacterized protein n=1 Tax=Streptomyces calidiresistens TaxID=1485586 RepID=A0A7W3T235_9ACTN|nr:hypothetical protein [Streptomyces calidiresistens]MBB0229530.1 hypothetical protein [Streptomyces calidiresistens]